MLEAVITLLIYVAVLALVIYLVIWVLSQLGIALPAQVLRIIWVIFILIVVLYLVRLLLANGGLPL